MNPGKFTILLIAISLVILSVAACTPSRVLVEESDQSESVVDSPPSPAVEESVPESGEEPESAPPVEPEGDTTADVPMPDGAYQVQKGKTSILYQVDGSIEDVVTFYQDELPGYGWEMAGPPDNAISNIATMLRKNEAGDRLAINMQYNNVGDFVRVTVTISRAR